MTAAAEDASLAAQKVSAKTSRKPAPEATQATPDLDTPNLSTEQLEAIFAEVQAELTKRRTRDRDEFLNGIRERAEKLGLPLTDVAAALTRRPAAGKRAVVIPKYRNPENPSQTWAGRGAQPSWIELADDGKPLPKFTIPVP